MSGSLETGHGRLPLPAFLPDATRAVVRGVDSADLAGAGIGALVVNALHLSRSPGISVIEAAGGIHRFMSWPAPILSDSGGFQAYSIISRSKSLGKVTADGFELKASPGAKRDLLTPEGCVERQFKLGADIIMCLDYCTHPAAPEERQRESVRLTVDWAKRGREEHARLSARLPSGTAPPRIFAVVQGGRSEELRRECAGRLTEIGFDGYGFGGWPVDARGRLEDSVGFTVRLLPRDKTLMGLGIGSPRNVAAAYGLGYRLFDCSLPTRDARRGRCFAKVAPDGSCTRVDIGEERYARDGAPLDPECDCLACRSYSRAYVHHLFAVEDRLGWRLATIHNLRCYSRLMAMLEGREGSGEGR